MPLPGGTQACGKAPGTGGSLGPWAVYGGSSSYSESRAKTGKCEDVETKNSCWAGELVTI